MGSRERRISGFLYKALTSVSKNLFPSRSILRASIARVGNRLRGVTPPYLIDIVTSHGDLVTGLFRFRCRFFLRIT
jgi:hypothetical protein